MKNNFLAFYLLLFLIALSGCVSVNNTKNKSNEPLSVSGKAGEETALNDSMNSQDKTGTNSSQPATDEESLTLTDRTVVMSTNYGDLHISFFDKAAPKTVENFVRLTYRKYYDGLIFHRMVNLPGNMVIIQGGDPQGNGRGGQSAFGQRFEDEIFQADGKTFRDASLYEPIDERVALYKKGYLAMANAGPNTNGSQFFIMLDDTKLPPNYTIFGKVAESDFPILDKIVAEVKPNSLTGDGKPDKEIKILSTTLK